MPITDFLQVNRIKAELEKTQKERDSLKALLAETERLSLHEIHQAVARLEEQKAQVSLELEELRNKANRETQELQASLVKKRRSLDQEIADLNQQVADRKKDLIVLDEELLLQSFGFYKLRYDLENSELYRTKLDQIRERQAAMIKAGKAVICPTNWRVNNSEKEGERMIKDYSKLIVRSFNNECDASIVNVKYNNVDAIEKKIKKAYEILNSLTKRMGISIVPEYLGLKLGELYLYHEYQMKKQEEKEEQKRIREEMREEAKALREIEEMKLKIEKEEKHFTRALEELDAQILKAKTEAEREALEQEKAKVQQKLAETEKNKQDVQNREQNTRAGYVYVISNIGAFGENVYKIGVTRRLDPEERVDELGGASVPFDFDIHAMIFSDDAPALEAAVHKAFDARRLNVINTRREFFSVSLDEVERVIKNNFNKPVEFTQLAEAAEYRQSKMIKSTGVKSAK